MVTQGAYAGMILEIILSIGFPIALLIIFNKKHLLSWKAFGIGVIVFIIFSRVIEKVLHALVLDPSGTALNFTNNPYVFILYAGLSAGIIEEVGRYIGFKFLKGQNSYGDGLSLGVGFGGMEALLIGAFAGVYSIFFAHMINSGTLPNISAQISAQQIAEVKQHFISQGFGTYFVVGIERVISVIMNLLLSLVVLLAIKRDTFKYVLYAIVIHAVFRFIPALYQTNIIKSMWITETLLIILGIICAYMIFKMKALYFEEEKLIQKSINTNKKRKNKKKK